MKHERKHKGAKPQHAAKPQHIVERQYEKRVTLGELIVLFLIRHVLVHHPGHAAHGTRVVHITVRNVQGSGTVRATFRRPGHHPHHREK